MKIEFIEYNDSKTFVTSIEGINQINLLIIVTISLSSSLKKRHS